MLYFIRHAQSQFNHASETLPEKMGANFSKKSQQYLSMKFDDRFIDCGLTEKGKEQCLEARQRMKDIQIDLVVVSPMRRTLMTCDLIFSHHKSNPKIIVDPDIREVFSSSCDIGGRIYESMEQMPHFDYSKIENPAHWYIDSIKNKQIKEHLLKQIEHIEDEKEKVEAAKKIKLEYLIKEYENISEKTFSDFEAQKKKFRELSKKYKNIAVVSHSENISYYCDCLPKNCQIVAVQATKF